MNSSEIYDGCEVKGIRGGWSAAASLVAAAALLMIVGCGRDEASAGLKAITPEAHDAHLRFLSSDLLEGRAPGTRGSQLAASYIANQFALSGLVPAVGDSSFMQPVPLVARSPSAQLSFRAPGGAAFRAALGPDFVAWSEDTSEVSSADAELVFVGYGISAPERDWDDYKGVDVSGRVLLMLSNDPGQAGSSRFRGDTLTYYGLWTYKIEEAARRGAVAVILMHEPTSAGVGWDVIRSSMLRERAGLEVAPGSARLAFEAWLSQEAAEQVVSMGGLDFTTLLEIARSEKFRPLFTGVRVSATVRNRVRRFSDVNVAGLLPGSDPQLASEVVVFTAHYDHLGIGEPVDSDSIYNGAHDNASGTALLLCLADAFARLPRRPARSILFLAVTAEESGLSGSSYYVENPLIPLARTVANVNIDGGNLWGPTEDVAVLGAEYSSIRAAAVQAARAEDLRLEGDPAPEQGYVYQSDQLSFMRAGVPAVMVVHGLDYIGRMPGWGEQKLQEYIETAYHRPGDEYRADLDLRGALQQGRVAFRIGLSLANGPERPVWNEGSELEAVRRWGRAASGAAN